MVDSIWSLFLTSLLLTAGATWAQPSDAKQVGTVDGSHAHSSSSPETGTTGALADSLGSLPPNPSLEDQLRYAASNHPGVRAAFERWVAASSSVAREKGWPDPVFSYAYYIEPVETAVGPQRHRFTLSQRIPWFGKLSAKGSAAEQAALAAEQDYVSEQLRLFERVAHAYYEYAYLQEAIRVTGENLRLLMNQEEVARARYRTQSASYSELVKAQVELGVLEDRLRTLQDRQESAATRLRETLGQDRDDSWTVTSSLTPPEFRVPSEQDVRQALQNQNPQLRSLTHQIAATDSRIDAVHREGLPDFAVGLQTILTDPSELTSFEGQGKDAWIATIAVQIPLWRGQYSGAEDSERAGQRALQFRHREQRLELLARAEELLFELRDAERKVDLYGGSLLPKARQSVEASATAFQTGKASFLDFIDAQRTLLQFQLDLARARADYGQKVAGLARIMGEPVVEIPNQNSEEGSK